MPVTSEDLLKHPPGAAPRRTLAARLRRLVFGVAPAETDLDRRGFQMEDAAARARIEAVIDAFLFGYHAAIEEPAAGPLSARLSALDAERRGFAFEGAGMGLALLDAFSLGVGPGKDRLRRFLDGPGPGDDHEYMIYVGAGWAFARLPGARRRLARLVPMRRYLAVDGLGFHEAFFHTERVVRRQEVTVALDDYGRRAFDQGVGRCLWFVEGAGPARVAAAIARFAAQRQPDLWAGVGLACTYAGGTDRAALEAVLAAAAPYTPHLAQGAAFAALARGRARNPSPHTDLACQVIWRRPALAVHELARAAEQETPVVEERGGQPPYEALRARIRNRYQEEQG